ncbi:MAG TPA: hypothetical protein VIF37_20450 [Methylobacter sp.]|jgi:hypothetical protein
MTTYWITFRIADARVGSKSYEDRYNALIEAIDTVATGFWGETTSFIAFSSGKSIDTIAAACKSAIAPTHDLFLIRVMDTKSAIICGKNEDQDIFALMPYLKKL